MKQTGKFTTQFYQFISIGFMTPDYDFLLFIWKNGILFTQLLSIDLNPP